MSADYDDECTYECTVCLAVSYGRPNHPDGVCPDAKVSSPK